LILGAQEKYVLAATNAGPPGGDASQKSTLGKNQSKNQTRESLVNGSLAVTSTGRRQGRSEMREGPSGADANTMMTPGVQIGKIAKADTSDIDDVKGRMRIERLDGQHDDLPDGLRKRNDKQRKNAGLGENVGVCKKTEKPGTATPITQTEKDAAPEGKVRDGIEGRVRDGKVRGGRGGRVRDGTGERVKGDITGAAENPHELHEGIPVCTLRMKED
jgi:hypothetical protein